MFKGPTERQIGQWTTHHRDHNHQNNPKDGQNWELLCKRCHQVEHKCWLAFGTTTQYRPKQCVTCLNMYKPAAPAQRHCTVSAALRLYRRCHSRPRDGCIHANFVQTGAETGRPSCTKPNLLNLPKDKRYRRCYVAPPGFKVITTDMAGAELRILAELAG